MPEKFIQIFLDDRQGQVYIDMGKSIPQPQKSTKIKMSSAVRKHLAKCLKAWNVLRI